MTTDDATPDLSASLLRLIADSESFEESLSATLRLACETAGWQYGEAWVPETDGGRRLHAGPHHDPDGRFAAFAATSEGMTFESGEGLIGRVWESGTPEWLDEFEAGTFLRHRDAAVASFTSAVAIPVVADGETLAVLAFFATDERPTDAEFAEAVGDAVRALGRVYVHKRVTDAVAAERATLDAILEASPVGIIVFDRDCVVERLNAPASDLLGLDPDSVVGTSAFDGDWTTEDLDGTYDEFPVETVLRTGEPVLDRRSVVSLPSREVTLSISAAPLFDADGTVAKVIGAVADVSERVEYERRLEESNARLESFASVLSHDVRSPLAVATGFLELARETGELTYLDRVERSHERIEELVDTLLILARRGRMVGSQSALSVAAVAEEAWKTVEHNGTDLVVHEAGEVAADRARLRQLFENLYTNAVRHAGDDVTVTVGPLDGEPGFFVEDDGVGIPAAEREEVLAPGHESRGGGIGLGLSIVAAITEGHGWTVSVGESASGGARFEFRTTAAE